MRVKISMNPTCMETVTTMAMTMGMTMLVMGKGLIARAMNFLQGYLNLIRNYLNWLRSLSTFQVINHFKTIERLDIGATEYKLCITCFIVEYYEFPIPQHDIREGNMYCYII